MHTGLQKASNASGTGDDGGSWGLSGCTSQARGNTGGANRN